MGFGGGEQTRDVSKAYIARGASGITSADHLEYYSPVGLFTPNPLSETREVQILENVKLAKFISSVNTSWTSGAITFNLLKNGSTIKSIPISNILDNVQTEIINEDLVIGDLIVIQLSCSGMSGTARIAPKCIFE